MNEPEYIEKNTKPVVTQMIFVGVLGLILAIFSSRILRAINNLAESIDMSGLIKISWLLIILITVLAVLVTWTNGTKKFYALTKNSIIVGRGSMSGARSQKVYSAGQITSVTLQQSRLGRRHNYGTVVINMDRLKENRTLRLANVVNPVDVAQRISNLDK